MPYIDKERRPDVVLHGPKNGAELNFVLTSELVDYIVRHGLTYYVISDVRGAVQGALQELERRVFATYEVRAIARNGDIQALYDLEDEAYNG